jgi:hypothetical protein
MKEDDSPLNEKNPIKDNGNDNIQELKPIKSMNSLCKVHDMNSEKLETSF